VIAKVRLPWIALVCVAAITTGCEEGILDVEHPGKAAALSKENAANRRVAHRRATVVIEELQPLIGSAHRPTATCHTEIRRPAQRRQGVLPVACANFEQRWPLRVQYGFLRCEPKGRYANREVVFTTPGGKDYAASVGARMVGYPRITPIFRRDAGPRYGSALTKAGLALCK
jgi:hypothetical protein